MKTPPIRRYRALIPCRIMQPAHDPPTAGVDIVWSDVYRVRAWGYRVTAE